MKPRIISGAARVGNVIESVLSAVRTGRATRAPRRTRLIAFRGLGNAHLLTVSGRVVRQATGAPALVSEEDTPSHAQLVAVYRAFDVEEVAGHVVTAEAADSMVTTSTDDAGYFHAELRPPHGESAWSAGWHKVQVSCLSVGAGDAVSTSADVFVPDARARLLLVSDLDDTAMDSETLNNWRMLRTVLFRNAKRRRPVPGVPELYQALHKGRDGVSNPVCYISSNAWNLYDIVLDYLDTHGLPRGAMFLNDWGSRARQFRTVAHAHKSTHVASLMRRFPTLPLLLVGDDTQEDPELYSQAALAHPEQVAAIWIRAVHTSPARRAAVQALRARVTAAGTAFVYAAASEVFAEHARERGWIGTSS